MDAIFYASLGIAYWLTGGVKIAFDSMASPINAKPYTRQYNFIIDMIVRLGWPAWVLRDCIMMRRFGDKYIRLLVSFFMTYVTYFCVLYYGFSYLKSLGYLNYITIIVCMVVLFFLRPVIMGIFFMRHDEYYN